MASTPPLRMASRHFTVLLHMGGVNNGRVIMIDMVWCRLNSLLVA